MNTRSHVLLSVRVSDLMFMSPQQFFSIGRIFRGKKGDLFPSLIPELLKFKILSNKLKCKN